MDSYPKSSCTQSLGLGHLFDSHGTAAAIVATGVEEFGASSQFE
jgi:hypothetical protein